MVKKKIENLGILFREFVDCTPKYNVFRKQGEI